MRVVFIAGMSHSGSTVVDLMLGGHPKFVGVGEMSAILDPELGHLSRVDSTTCSCGSTLSRCPFWGPLCTTLAGAPNATSRERYLSLLEAFTHTFGQDRTLVDSSKILESLQAWVAIPEVELRVIHLVRDVRSWVISRKDQNKRVGESRLRDLIAKHGWRGLDKWAQGSTMYGFRAWYRENRRIQSYLRSSGIPGFQLGYEELSLYPSLMIDAICGFLRVESSDAMLSLAGSASHVALGNRMHSQPDKRDRVLHDHRWLRRNDWLLPALLLPRIMRYNTAEVYRNVPDSLWRQ